MTAAAKLTVSALLVVVALYSVRAAAARRFIVARDDGGGVRAVKLVPDEADAGADVGREAAAALDAKS